MIPLAGALLAGACRTHPRLEGPPPALEFRLASLEPQDQFIAKKERWGDTLYVSNVPVVTLADVTQSFVKKQGRDDFLLLNLTGMGQVRLDAATMSHLDQPVAVLIDGEVVYAPTLKTSLTKQIPIRIGKGGITYEEAKRLDDAVKDQRDFGPQPRPPAEQPPAATPVTPAPASPPGT